MNRDAYDAEIARLESLADSDTEFEGAVRVEGTVARDRITRFLLVIEPGELDELTTAAAKRGVTVSEFIREFALKAARDMASTRGGGAARQTRHKKKAGVSGPPR
jgi:hypothetical protein